MRLLLVLATAALLAGTAAADSLVTAEAIQKRIADAIAARIPASGHYKVSLSDPSFQLHAPAEGAWQIAALTFNPAQQSFQATLGVSNSQGQKEYVPLTGRALAVIDVPALMRDVAVGETISSQDLTTLEFPADRLTSALITSPSGLVGQAARRQVRAGTPLFTYDVTKPLAIKKGDIVTVTFELPGIQLSTQGQAQGNAGKGDTVSILNTTSRRTIEASVTGAGTAVVRTFGPAITAAN